MPQQNPPQNVTVVVRSSSGWRVMAWIGWAAFFVCAFYAMGLHVAFEDYFDTTEGLQERFFSGAEDGVAKIAVIEVSGTIMEGDGHVKRQIDRVRKDEQVRAIVLRIDSPGGTVTGSDYLYHHLAKLRKDRDLPIVVSMGSMAASGGYYIAMAVGDQKDSIFAEPTSTTGSIGVIIPHYDLSGLLARFDMKDDSIASHPRKQMLSMTREITPENREILQRYVGESFKRFKEIVKSGRPKFRENPEKLDELATGEIFSADQALGNGLIDRIGFIEAAIERAAELAGINAQKARVVRFKRPVSFLNITGMAAAQMHRSDFDFLSTLASPRAYYLSTTLPALAGSAPQFGGQP